jgi:hypothetical protein
LLKYATIAALFGAAGSLFVTSSLSAPVNMGSGFAVIQQSNLALVGWLECHRYAGQTQASFYRHGPYIYQHRGWWYARPWWDGTGVGSDAVTGYDDFGGCFNDYEVGEGDYADVSKDPHIRWCIEHHRLYDPESNNFLGKDGRQYQCSSPYD